MLFDEFSELRSNREELDQIILDWINHDLSINHINGTLSYRNTKGESSNRNLGELISHLFNHQTHHRGQVSTLLSQKGLDIGTTDYLLDIPVID